MTPIPPRPGRPGAATPLAAPADCAYLAGLHPGRYGKLLDGVRAVYLRGSRPAPDRTVALRLVSLADRLYGRAIPVVVSGVALDELFPAEMLAGGYRKKYLRAVSRLTALARMSTSPRA